MYFLYIRHSLAGLLLLLVDFLEVEFELIKVIFVFLVLALVGRLLRQLQVLNESILSSEIKARLVRVVNDLSMNLYSSCRHLKTPAYNK